MSVSEELKQILSNVLEIETSQFKANTPLFGAIPEFDSMAVMLLLIEFERVFSFDIDNSALSADSFSSLGQLETLIIQSRAAA